MLGQSEISESVYVDNRFSDPLIAEIVEVWRLRQDMVRATTRLTLQIKSIMRRYCAGDKAAAETLYKRVMDIHDGKSSEPCGFSADAYMAVSSLIDCREPLDKTKSAMERRLTKLGARLPIASFCDGVQGFGHLGLAKVVAECGDLSVYVSDKAVHKRAGLAVIDGERQRKKAGDDALKHGYNPERHAVFWNISAALIKAQGKGDDAGPYRRLYDQVKDAERPRVETDGHAHNRAMRMMVKQLLTDLRQAWVDEAVRL